MTPKVIIIRNLNGKEDGIMKTIRYFAIIACAAAVAASCMKDELKDNVYVEPIFTAVREDFGGPASKTMLTDNYKVVWCSGDEVGVFDGSVYPREGVASGSKLVNTESGWEYGLRFKTTDNGASAGFAYDVYDAYKDDEPQVYTPGAADSYLLIHPMAVNFIANVSEGKFRAWLSSSQKAEAGTYDSARGFAVAKTQNLSQPVAFKNAVSLLEFVIPTQMDAKITKITVTPNASGEYLAGDLLIDYSGDSPKTSLWALSNDHNALESGKSKYSALTLTPEKGTAFASGKYYAVVCPGTLTKGLTVTATLTTGMTLTRSSEKNCTFKESYVYGMGKLDASDKNYSGGIKEFPYVFSVVAKDGKDNKLAYVEKTDPVLNDRLYESIYTDGQTNASLVIKSASETTTLDASRCWNKYWSNMEGWDICKVKSMVSEASAGTKYTYVPCGYFLTLPLQTDFSGEFYFSYGFYTTGGGVADWNVYVSKDGVDWEIAGTNVHVPNYHYHYNVKCSTSLQFATGDYLYIKLQPTGNRKASDLSSTTTGWNSDACLHSCICIWKDPDFDTQKPSEYIYYEAFDEMLGGADYLLGKKIGNMVAFNGDSFQEWNGLIGENTYKRHGYAQIGYANVYAGHSEATNTKVTGTIGKLTTPELNYRGDMLVNFKAMVYRTNALRTNYRANLQDAIYPDVTSIVVNISGSGSFEASSQVTSMTLAEIPTDSFATKSLCVYGASENTKLEFTSPEGSKFSRWFIDEICVTKL